MAKKTKKTRKAKKTKAKLIENNLLVDYPELAAKWHPTKNGELTPEMVTNPPRGKVWWLHPYDDPETGKHYEFEWEATVSNRIRGTGCPYLSGKTVWPGYNDLATKYPVIAAQWHPTKNGDFTPEMVTSSCHKKVWWFQPYDDPETGKHFDFEWEETVANHIRRVGCPFLSGRAVWPGYNDLATKHPALAAQWHPTKNGTLTPEMVTCSSRKKVWWQMSYDAPETGIHFDFEWEANVCDRVAGNGCPYLNGRAVWLGYNDLATKYPAIAAQWHPTKNGTLTPEMITYSSGKKVWWMQLYVDPETGEHFNFEWEAVVYSRIGGTGCPYLSGQAVWPGYNDLATKYPVIAAQWHPTKNGMLTPEMISFGSRKKVWWQMSYDDPETGMHFDFEWETTVYNRVNGKGCPYLSGKAVWPGYNDLATKYPEIAEQWHPTKNGALTPELVTYSSGKKVWWQMSYNDPETGKHFDFEWKTTVANRANGRGCPYLSGQAVWPGYNDLESCYPEIAREWNHEKNRKRPSDVHKYEDKKRWWICPVCGKSYYMSAYNRTALGYGCDNKKCKYNS